MIKNAPFTPAEVESLNGFQQCEFFHPFTCDKGHQLVATEKGFICLSCKERPIQTWCHDFMIDWKENSKELEKLLSDVRVQKLHATLQRIEEKE